MCRGAKCVRWCGYGGGQWLRLKSTGSDGEVEVGAGAIYKAFLQDDGCGHGSPAATCARLLASARVFSAHLIPACIKLRLLRRCRSLHFSVLLAGIGRPCGSARMALVTVWAPYLTRAGLTTTLEILRSALRSASMHLSVSLSRHYLPSSGPLSCAFLVHDSGP